MRRGPTEPEADSDRGGLAKDPGEVQEEWVDGDGIYLDANALIAKAELEEDKAEEREGVQGTLEGSNHHGKVHMRTLVKKNPAYGRHQLSQPMRIVGPIQI